MGESLEEATLIRDLCRQRGLVAAVNFQLRYSPNNLAAVALAKAGLLGELHDMEVQVRTYTPWKLWTFLATAPRLEILYHSIHYLDLIRSWFGNPSASTLRQSETRNPQPWLPPNPPSSWITASGSVSSSSPITATTSPRKHSAASSSGKEQAAQSAWTWASISTIPKACPTPFPYAERGISDGKWHTLPVKGNWFPDAFVGSMGALTVLRRRIVL